MNATDTPSRPFLRYHGGKFRLAPWIISHFPPHRIYVEPYGGAASVLFRKDRSFAEVYNDLDDKIVNVFRVIQDRSTASELIRLLQLTPYARSEFDLAFDNSDNPVEQARRTIIIAFMGFSSDSATRGHRTGFRGLSIKTVRYSGNEWANYPDALKFLVDRFRGVVIESMPALKLIEKYDSTEAFFYLDPPYLHSTRSKGHGYQHEMTDDDHLKLIEKVKGLKGMAILSGFRNEIYDSNLTGWTRAETKSRGQAGKGGGSKINTECLWISPRAQTEGRLAL